MPDKNPPVVAPLDFDALAQAAATSPEPPATLSEILPLALEEGEEFAVVDEAAVFGEDHFIPDAVIEGMVPPEDDTAA